MTRTVAERAIDAGLETKREVRWGPPPHSVISYALENEIDLIVMGTHGRTAYERYLLGSVAERVVRFAPVPVLTVDLEDRSDGVDAAENGLVPHPAPDDSIEE